MQTPARCRIERNDLPSMLSTLCSYENLFGPYHQHTLRLMAQAGLAFWHHGEAAYARPLLERSVRVSAAMSAVSTKPGSEPLSPYEIFC